jgi:hypothetical protein
VLTDKSYTKPTNNDKSQDPVAKFYGRLRAVLTLLQKLQEQLEPEVWARFAPAYSRYWLISLDHGEKAVAPDTFYRDWAAAQEGGEIALGYDKAIYYDARAYAVYQSPRERARKVLGIEALAPIGGEGRAT